MWTSSLIYTLILSVMCILVELCVSCIFIFNLCVISWCMKLLSELKFISAFMWWSSTFMSAHILWLSFFQDTRSFLFSSFTKKAYSFLHFSSFWFCAIDWQLTEVFALSTGDSIYYCAFQLFFLSVAEIHTDYTSVVTGFLQLWLTVETLVKYIFLIKFIVLCYLWCIFQVSEFLSCDSWFFVMFKSEISWVLELEILFLLI